MQCRVDYFCFGGWPSILTHSWGRLAANRLAPWIPSTPGQVKSLTVWGLRLRWVGQTAGVVGKIWMALCAVFPFVKLPRAPKCNVMLCLKKPDHSDSLWWANATNFCVKAAGLRSTKQRIAFKSTIIVMSDWSLDRVLVLTSSRIGQPRFDLVQLQVLIQLRPALRLWKERPLDLDSMLPLSANRYCRLQSKLLTRLLQIGINWN